MTTHELAAELLRDDRNLRIAIEFIDRHGESFDVEIERITILGEFKIVLTEK